MQISVVIPTWNERRQIAEAIQSVRLAGPCEVVIADGGSDDGTVNCCDGADRVISSARGRATQMNAGAAAAAGDWLVFLHADCRLEPDTLQCLQSVLATSSAQWGCFRQRINRSGCVYRVLERGNEWRVRLLGWVYGDQCLFVSRRLFEEVGGYPTLSIMEDLYLSKRLKRSGRPVVMTSHPISVSARHWDGRGVWRQTLRNWWLIGLAHLGVSSDRLARGYYAGSADRTRGPD